MNPKCVHLSLLVLHHLACAALLGLGIKAIPREDAVTLRLRERRSSSRTVTLAYAGGEGGLRCAATGSHVEAGQHAVGRGQRGEGAGMDGLPSPDIGRCAARRNLSPRS